MNYLVESYFLVSRCLLCASCIFYSGAAAAQTTSLDDDAPFLLYFGDWSRVTDVLASQGSYHSSNRADARMIVEFDGDFARVLAPTGPGRGRGEIRLCSQDGADCELAVLDQQSKIEQHAQVVFARYGLIRGRYRIEIQVSDTANKGVAIDGIAFGSALEGSRYINNQTASCSNHHAGDSPAAPWCDFNNVNGETFASGARLLLARGASWDQQLGKLYGEGTPEQWIEIDAYGQGDAPVIRRSGAPLDRALWLDNPSYWSVSNLEIANAGAGLIAYYSTNGHSGLRLANLYTHDNNAVHYRSADDWTPAADLPGMYHGAAIFITGNVPVTENIAAISDVEISNIESLRDSDPLDIAGFNPSAGRLNFLSTTLGHHAVRDVRIHNVSFHDAKGAPNFDNVERLSLFSSRLTRMCTEHQEIGTTAMFFWSVDDVAITNNVISDVPYTESPDGTGTDLESVSSRVRFRGNWYMNNVGAGIEVLAARGQGDFHHNHEVTGNTFYQNGLSGPSFFMGIPQEASLFILNQTGKREAVTGRAQGNLYFEPGGFISSEPLGQYQWQFTGNQRVSAMSLFDARVRVSGGRSAPALRPEFFNGADFRELPAVQSGERWEAQGSLLTPFDMQPPACSGCAVARAWTAPRAGTVAIRGWAMKNDLGGDGVQLRISRNGAQVWPPEPQWRSLAGTDREGFATDVEDLVVNQGDIIRVEVAAGSSNDSQADMISWSPTIAYTQADPRGLLIVQDDVNDGRISYSGAWGVQEGAREAQGFDASLSLAFEGTQATVYGRRGPEHAAAAFTVCASDPERCLDEVTVNLFDSADHAERVLWTSPIVPAGAYRLHMRAVPSPSGTGGRVTFDYATVSTDARFINNDDEGSRLDQVEYYGAGWMRTGNIHYHGGASAEAYYLVRFVGAQLTVSGGKNVDRGIAAFSVCDRDGRGCGPETMVDAYAPALQIKQMLWTSPVLAPGEHSVRVRPTHTRNAASHGTIIDFDRAIVD